MSPLDVALLAVIGLSTLIGAFRGLLKEVIGVAGIVLAAVAARTLAPAIVSVLGYENSPGGDVVVMVIIFVAVLVAVAVLGWVLRRVFDALQLGPVDRFFGGVLGLVRGVAITTVGLTLLVLSVDPRSRVFDESVGLRWHAPGVEWLGTHLPLDGARRSFVDRWEVVSPRR